MKRTVGEVMTYRVVTARPTTTYKELVRLMEERGITGIPVVDDAHVVLGVVSESDLVLKEQGPPKGRPRFAFGHISIDNEKAAARTAGELMTSPAVTIEADATLAEAARLMHARDLKRLPVVDGQHRLAGIVSHRDLLKIYLRLDQEIQDEIVLDVIRDKMWLSPEEGHVHVSVKGGVVHLTGVLERRTLVDILASMIYQVDGVVAIDSDMSWRVDDTHLKVPSMMPWGVLPGSLRRP